MYIVCVLRISLHVEDGKLWRGCVRVLLLRSTQSGAQRNCVRRRVFFLWSVQIICIVVDIHMYIHNHMLVVGVGTPSHLDLVRLSWRVGAGGPII